MDNGTDQPSRTLMALFMISPVSLPHPVSRSWAAEPAVVARRDRARSPRGRMAGDLLVGLWSGGVQTGGTMFVRGRSRAGAPTPATWRRRADAGPSRGLEPADTGVDPETKAGRLGMRSPRRRPSGRLCRRPDRHATRPTVEDAAQLDRCYAAARVDLRAHPLVGTAPAAGPVLGDQRRLAARPKSGDGSRGALHRRG